MVTERTEFDTYRLWDAVNSEYYRRRVPVNKLKVLSDDDTMPSERLEDGKLDAIEVETITAKRTKDDGTHEYKVKWLGHHSDQSTWQPANTLKNAKKEVAGFEKTDKARRRLQAQLLDERQQAYELRDKQLYEKEERIRKKIQEFVTRERPHDNVTIVDQLDAWHQCFKPTAKYNCGNKTQWLKLIETGTLENMAVPTNESGDSRRQRTRTTRERRK
jgi:hypothetical protein